MWAQCKARGERNGRERAWVCQVLSSTPEGTSLFSQGAMCTLFPFELCQEASLKDKTLPFLSLVFLREGRGLLKSPLPRKCSCP